MTRTWWRILTPRRAAAARHGRRHALRPRSYKPKTEQLEERCLLSGGIEFRTIDGTGNNLANPNWGAANTDLLRLAPAQYGNGISTPGGANRPGAREVSNQIVAHPDDALLNARQMADYIYAWGQFLDHDLDLTPNASPRQAFDIPVPRGDPSFDPDRTGTQVIPFSRSASDPLTGTSRGNPRQQVNVITAWIDASQVYGSDAVRAAALRTFVGGKLKTSPGDLLPLNNTTYFPGGPLPNANDSHQFPDGQLFVAGDVRANENVELTSLHTLFVREHNRLADQIYPTLSASLTPAQRDELAYQMARAIVGAEMQVITYKEFVPALLGPDALRPYTGYNANVNPGIANEFSTAAFRIHTLINDDVEFLDNNGNPVTFTYVDEQGHTVTVEGEVLLREAFFNPGLLKGSGIDPILKYLASDRAEEVDNKIVDSLRNFLFALPGQGGFDLASFNIQRGRDHGLADYNTVRAAYGLPRVTRFEDITSDPHVRNALRQLYGNVNNIDLWVGVLAEDHVPGTSTGPLMRRVLADQFERLRDGDRFWYQRVFSGTQLAELENTRLADILRRNTTINNIQDDAFAFHTTLTGTVFFDLGRDGHQGPLDPGLAGFRVELLDEAGAVIATALTAADGSYRFAEPLDIATPYRVRLVLPGFLETTTPNPSAQVVYTKGATTSGVNFGVALRTGLRRADVPPGILPSDLIDLLP